MSEFVWEPTPEFIDNANVTRFMRAHGIDDYFDLVKRTQDDTEWFWNAVIEDLGIEFSKPYTQILETGAGLQWPKWFIGGEINLTYNCVDRHAAATDGSTRRALLWEGEDGEVRELSYG